MFSKGPCILGPWDRLSTHFPNPRVVRTLKRPAVEEKYLFPAEYKFVIPDLDALSTGRPRGV